MFYKSYSPYDDEPNLFMGLDEEELTFDEILAVKPVNVHIDKFVRGKLTVKELVI